MRGLSPLTFVTLLAACSSSSAAPTPDGDDLPSIAGAWTVTLSAFPAGTLGSEGRCYFDPFTIQLTRGGATDAGVDYTGSRSGFTMTCIGFTDSATVLTGWNDTTIVTPADTMSARVNAQCVGLFFQCLTGAPSVSMAPTSKLRMWATATPGSLNGDFWYVEEDGATPLEGSWSAVR